MKDIRPIRSDKDYEWALGEVARYFEREPKRGTPQGDRFEVLLGLIEAYEAKHWAISAPDPVEAIKAQMEQTGRTQADLAALVGSRPRASEILKRQRGLTMSMIRKLSAEWRIPAEVLIQPYRLATEKVEKRKRV
ncbi:type II toxin-antitoxin system HigA family antitoxin [Parvibaculum sp.]|uniref:helix-turn-helix domain-containing protein n=1 Tax=Parvibaculum sp. TaxID=2024848 RepID=UPI00272FAC1F|nr:XRE family transcriptional regulator [Parvibaculum sp.]MDP1626937.1 XRE family transcriptional regulator [Parvibaculum sp.]MDP2151667.1 XRE family transcriptional regulator [Parvibaculum sp.]MDP3328948.1 XRE family transcriptional regulator [Parvibaculum sp.]